jgi:hypothetical protein
MYKGLVSENINREGKTPDKNDLLHMYVRGDAIKRVLIKFS